MSTNYKQNDSKWANYPYAGETMAVAGCGATALADLLDKLPTEIADWLTNHGYASNGSGTYHEGIPACLKAYGYDSKKITSISRAGLMSDSSFETFKSTIQNGYCGILLMGGERTGCRNSYWCGAGHYIAIVGYKDGKYYVYDPAWSARDGYHAWDDFAGNIKHVFTSTVKWNKGKSASKKKEVSGYTFTTKQIKGGSQGVEVLLLQEILKSRSYYTSLLDRSYGNQTILAVKKYQQNRSLKVDGICGNETWSDLLALPTSGKSWVLKQIQTGDKGVEVLLLQEILGSRGYYKGALDWSFGNQLLTALKKYQKDRNGRAGAVDGICGNTVWRDLLGM